jgi:hypothetical protein
MAERKKRKPLGWAKDKIGKRLKSRQFLSRVEMDTALKMFLETRSEGHSGLVMDTPQKNVDIVNKRLQ